MFRKVADYSSAIPNLITGTNFRIRDSILETHLAQFVKLFNGYKLTNVPKGSILAVAMVLDTSTSLCFFRKPFNATCLIICFNMCSHIMTL